MNRPHVFALYWSGQTIKSVNRSLKFGHSIDFSGLTWSSILLALLFTGLIFAGGNINRVEAEPVPPANKASVQSAAKVGPAPQSNDIKSRSISNSLPVAKDRRNRSNDKKTDNSENVKNSVNPVRKAAAPTNIDSKTIHARKKGSLSAYKILNSAINPGFQAQLHWNAGQSFSGRSIKTPVLVAHGARMGPVLCLTAAVHGDELNGVEIVRRVINKTDPKHLAGTLVGVPIVNLLGLMRGSRYLPDRRDLNRYFPGYAGGSAASRIAYQFFERIVRHCNFLVDFHTGSAKRTNLPQLRADLRDPAVRIFTKQFGGTAVLHHPGRSGMLRWEASKIGIPTVTFELGKPSTLQPEHVKYGVEAIDMLLHTMGMAKQRGLQSKPQHVYYTSRWVRANRGGIMIASTRLGAHVVSKQVLGWVTDPLTNEKTKIVAEDSGRVLGMALNQFVLPGFAAFHIGIEAVETDDAGDAVPANPTDGTQKAEISTVDDNNRYFD